MSDSDAEDERLITIDDIDKLQNCYGYREDLKTLGKEIIPLNAPVLIYERFYQKGSASSNYIIIRRIYLGDKETKFYYPSQWQFLDLDNVSQQIETYHDFSLTEAEIVKPAKDRKCLYVLKRVPYVGLEKGLQLKKDLGLESEDTNFIKFTEERAARQAYKFNKISEEYTEDTEEYDPKKKYTGGKTDVLVKQLQEEEENRLKRKRPIEDEVEVVEVINLETCLTCGKMKL